MTGRRGTSVRDTGSDWDGGGLARALILAGARIGIPGASLSQTLRPHSPMLADLDRAASLADAAGRSGAMFALAGDKRLVFSDAGGAFLMYAEKGGSWVALGDPVGDPAQFRDLMTAFATNAARARRVPVVYQSAHCADFWAGQGMSCVKIGEEALIPLTDFTLAGPARKRLRTTRNRALRDGLEFALLPAGSSDGVLRDLRAVSDDWLDGRAGREKGFSVGRFDPDWMRRWPVALLRLQGRIVAFATVLTAGQGRDATLDLMRQDRDAPPAAMEFLLIELMQALAGQGAQRLSLGMAPLSGLDGRNCRFGRVGDLIYRRGGRFYGFEGLRRFKQKFDPDWQPVYLALPEGCSALLAMTDIARLIAAPTQAGSDGAANSVSAPGPGPARKLGRLKRRFAR